MEFTDNEKYAVIAILTAIMEADTIIHPKEIAFMDEIMKNLDISVHDLDHMEAIDLTLSKSIIFAMPIERQQVVKKWCQTMIEIDGIIDLREVDVINQIFSKQFGK